MTVDELRKRLDGLDPKTHIVVYRENESGMDFFEISDLSLSTGDALRDEYTRKAGFKFDKDGPATWLFIR